MPFQLSTVIIIAFGSFCLAGISLFLLLKNRLQNIWMRLRSIPVPPGSAFENISRFMLTILWIVASLAVLFFAAFIQSFQNFTKQELVAEVYCKPVKEAPGAMVLEFTPVIAGRLGVKQGFLIKGDQWCLQGDILKWDEWLNFAGVETMFKLTRIQGRFVNVHDERFKPTTPYSLTEKEDDPRWRWLYKSGYRLRFVDAVYGSTVYTYPSEDKIYQVYVTNSGFSVRPKKFLQRG